MWYHDPSKVRLALARNTYRLPLDLEWMLWIGKRVVDAIDGAPALLNLSTKVTQDSKKKTLMVFVIFLEDDLSIAMETKAPHTTRNVFTPAEIAYLRSQRLGRLATVGADGQPHVVPVGFRYNPERGTIDIGGHDFAKRKKFRDARNNPRVAIVMDDLASVNPWRVRGIEIRGEAEVLETGGREIGPGYDPEMFRIIPTRIVSWGIEAE